VQPEQAVKPCLVYLSNLRAVAAPLVSLECSDGRTRIFLENLSGGERDRSQAPSPSTGHDRDADIGASNCHRSGGHSDEFVGRHAEPLDYAVCQRMIDLGIDRDTIGMPNSGISYGIPGTSQVRISGSRDSEMRFRRRCAGRA
jgi:hypothetical protein